MRNETRELIRAIVNDLIFFGERPNWTGNELLSLFLNAILIGIPCYIYLVLLFSLIPVPAVNQ